MLIIFSKIILTSKASVRSSIIRGDGPALDAQSAFRNNFENIINRRVDIVEDIERFQKTLQYARSKVDYVIGENVYMLPSDMSLQIGSVNNYNNKILVSASEFTMGSNIKVNLTEDKPNPKPVKSIEKETVHHKTEEHKVIQPHKTVNTEHKIIPSHKTDYIKQQTDIKNKLVSADKITHEEEKATLILGITTAYLIWRYLIR